MSSNAESSADFDMMITIIPFLMSIVFAVVIGAVIFVSIRRVRNSKAKQENIFAKVIAKRLEVQNNNDSRHSAASSRTNYYIMLEFDNGSRREYLDTNNVNAFAMEGDSGYAAIKGDTIIAFERSSG
ncbi:DUF2500 domain-containing protein [Paenibacillus sp. strain BS8-2]